MNVLFLQRYNNYANRIIKRDELYIEDVLDVQASENKETFLLENVNFNPNDGVTTELIVGDTTTNQFPGWIPDYIIVYNPADKIHVESLNKDFTPFTSTWFVTEAERTRSSQYKLGLKSVRSYVDAAKPPMWLRRIRVRSHKRYGPFRWRHSTIFCCRRADYSCNCRRHRRGSFR